MIKMLNFGKVSVREACIGITKMRKWIKKNIGHPLKTLRGSEEV